MMVVGQVGIPNNNIVKFVILLVCIEILILLKIVGSSVPHDKVFQVQYISEFLIHK